LLNAHQNGADIWVVPDNDELPETGASYYVAELVTDGTFVHVDEATLTTTDGILTKLADERGRYFDSGDPEAARLGSLVMGILEAAEAAGREVTRQKLLELAA
jgi:hypothetical protein